MSDNDSHEASTQDGSQDLYSEEEEEDEYLSSEEEEEEEEEEDSDGEISSAYSSGSWSSSLEDIDKNDEDEEDDDGGASLQISRSNSGFPRLSFLRRRFLQAHSEGEMAHSSHGKDERTKDERDNRKHVLPNTRRHRKFRWYRPNLVNSEVLSGFATIILCTSFLIWISLLIVPELPSSRMTTREQARLRNRQRAEAPAKQAQRDEIMNMIRNPVAAFEKILDPRIAEARKMKPSVEALKPGCERAPWQDFSFPTCNDIHEIDLAAFLSKVAKRKDRRSRNGVPLGYLSDGLWRTVWSVLPRDADQPVVIKMMKGEHDVDERNLDRHRRDALVMERLTSSPYVVDIFGYCGNTILTEYIATTLDDIIRDESFNTTNFPSRQTSQGRLRLALDVAKGVDALHSIPGGPIVHADLQAKQFLVAPDGKVKINDFNRCRFVAHKNTTGEKCLFKVPTAPGKARAPEEYAYTDLDEKLDIFSVANIYYGILAGEDPWTGWSTTEVKKTVQKGFKPLVPEEFRQKGTSDEALQNLTLRAYELNPRERISAAELVKDLETLLSKAWRATT